METIALFPVEYLLKRAVYVVYKQNISVQSYNKYTPELRDNK